MLEEHESLNKDQELVHVNRETHHFRGKSTRLLQLARAGVKMGMGLRKEDEEHVLARND
jgi:hypothetical protein